MRGEPGHSTMAAQVDDLELLVAYYTDLDPRPELFGSCSALPRRGRLRYGNERRSRAGRLAEGALGCTSVCAKA